MLAALEHTDVATALARRAGGDAHQLVASIEIDEELLDYGAAAYHKSGSTIYATPTPRSSSPTAPRQERQIVYRRAPWPSTVDPSRAAQLLR